MYKRQPNNIQNYCSELIQPLKEYLKSLNVELEEEAYFCNHIFALQLPQEIDIEVLKDNFSKNKIYLSVRGNHLRLSVNVFNESNDIDKLIAVISSTLSQHA